MLKMQGKIRKAKSQEHISYLESAHSYSKRFTKAFLDWCLLNDVIPRPLTSTNAPDGSVYRKGDKTGQSGRPIWIQVDERIPARSDLHPSEAASILFQTFECVDIMEDPTL